ncbi:hypothetical protein J8281_15080 [Aquimarina sp. U1-2]|uniref:hypothetical protein n=1 Tax=Aquimarina sp. U1-2 TaxID=2823141 RepID=UPI001AEC9530|nr:hypothetical protein [Aquimarina sp. U1-2]MBP2833517.1 hypothetical protein [Aquimarina sp. U1-2]
MKKIWILLFGLTSNFLIAQIENTSSIRIDRESAPEMSKFSLSGDVSTSKSNKDFTLYTAPKELKEYSRRNRQPFSMNGDDGFYKPEVEGTPKWFKKEKEIKDAYKSDQYFGDFKSGGRFVRLIYRDHGSVDGDLVRIFVNDDVIASKVFLSASFQGLKIDLLKGFNKIDIQALNQGESGPNTAEFHLYDDQGVLLANNEWNLTTGVKATLIVVKEQ